jgi:hypothetical protein
MDPGVGKKNPNKLALLNTGNVTCWGGGGDTIINYTLGNAIDISGGAYNNNPCALLNNGNIWNTQKNI